MHYEDAVRYLLSFSDFETSGRFHDRPDVAPVHSLLRRLGDPHTGRPTVHVAGSKGKGSVSAMVESMLRASGLRTGLFTSPHLHSYCERIRIGGEAVSETEFAALAAAVHPEAEAEGSAPGERSLVTFDLLTAMGFLAFRERAVDVQVVEVGLGGRVDSTNVFGAKEVAVITPLSLEHTAVLGDTIEQIAAEKAAIVRAGCTAVMAPQRHPEARRVVREAAAAEGARLVDVAEMYRWELVSHGPGGQEVVIEREAGVVMARLPLAGAHQAENAATAVAAVDALREQSSIAVSDEQIAAGLAAVRWPGRLEVLREDPVVIVDGAHNRDSARRLAEALRDDFGVGRAVFVVGASADKDIAGLAEEIAPIASQVFAARSKHPRSMAPEEIAGAFARLGVKTKNVDSVSAAIQAAMAISDRGGVICLVGSLFVAAEGREYVLGLNFGTSA